MKPAAFLCALSLTFFGLFLYQQRRSPAEAALRQHAAIEEAARRAGVEPGLALALAWDRGGRLEAGEVRDLLERYLDRLQRYGARELALAALAGHGDLVEEAMEAARHAREPLPEGAVRRLLERPEGIDVVRLQSMASRLPAVRRAR